MGYIRHYSLIYKTLHHNQCITTLTDRLLIAQLCLNELIYRE